LAEHDPAKPGDKPGDVQHQADEAHRKLKKAEQRADETIKHAADDPAELSKEQEAAEQRLRREAKEGGGMSTLVRQEGCG
jgi:hypothetical protein